MNLREPAARRALARRLGILHAAALVFRARGFAATGMRDIAQAAALSPANLYYYFRSKEELLYFCQDYSLDQLLEAARAVRKGYAFSSAQRIRTLIDTQLRLMLDQPGGAVAHLEVDALSPSLRERIVKKRDRYERSVRRLIEDGVREGVFAPCQAAIVTRAILGAVNWTVQWYRPEGPLTPAAVAGAYSEFLVRGLLK